MTEEQARALLAKLTDEEKMLLDFLRQLQDEKGC